MKCENLKFTIPIAPVTKKNSQRIIFINAGGRKIPKIIPSEQYKAYEAKCEAFIPKACISTPINVKALYYLPTRRKTDLVNLHEALHDILVKYGCVEDDNYTIIKSTDGSRVFYDKDNPRTEVEIEWD